MDLHSSTTEGYPESCVCLNPTLTGELLLLREIVFDMPFDRFPCLPISLPSTISSATDINSTNIFILN